MRKLFFLFTTFCLLCPNIFGQNVQFEATAPSTVVAGQQFRLNYTVTITGDAGRLSEPELPELTDFNNLFGPVETANFRSSSTVNNKVTTNSFVTYTFTLSAKKEGTFTIPPVSIKVGNSNYKSNSLEIKVLPPDQAAAAASANSSAGNQGQQGGQSSTSNGSGSSDDVFLRAIVSKNSVYENEGFTITFKLYYRVDIKGFESLKFPEYDGFVAQQVELPQNQQANMENYNGQNYNTGILKQDVLFPINSGKITIPAAKINVVTLVRSQRRQRSIFDDFLNMSEEVTRSISTPPVTIDVKPLPAGKPASFSGTVGDFKMTSSISTNQLKTNESVTVKVNISGAGNLNLIKNPDIIFPNDFDKIDPEVNRNTKVSASGVTGSRTIEYSAIPRYAGNFTIPSAEFSYFDLKSGTYKTLKTDEFQITVEQGEGDSGANMSVINATNKENIRFLGQDIRYIKTGSPDFHKGNFLFGTLKYLLFYIIPALLFLILFWIYRKQAAMNANIALVRTKKANKVASKRLKTAEKYLKENKTELFYDETLKAVWGYLSDKLNIPISALTKDNVEANLLNYGVSESLIKDFRDILDTAEFARFAPAQAGGTMDELYDATVQAIHKMENTIKR